MQKLLTFFFSENISIYAISNGQSFNETLTNDIVSFEQLGADHPAQVCPLCSKGSSPMLHIKCKETSIRVHFI